jgi:hypothetical protein
LKPRRLLVLRSSQLPKASTSTLLSAIAYPPGGSFSKEGALIRFLEFSDPAFIRVVAQEDSVWNILSLVMSPLLCEQRLPFVILDTT